jgi:hypothetical protein
MSSAAQIAANKKNAQSSTGPKTEAGKKQSSKNSLRHGLAAEWFVIPGENEERFEALRAELFQHHQPANITEELLVEHMAQAFWLTQRAMAYQRYVIYNCEDPRTMPASLGVLIRYQTVNERAFQKALATLTKLQQERTKDRIGFAPRISKTDPPPTREVPPTDAPEPPIPTDTPNVIPISVPERIMRAAPSPT